MKALYYQPNCGIAGGMHRLVIYQRSLWPALSARLGTQSDQPRGLVPDGATRFVGDRFFIVSSPQAAHPSVWVPLIFWLVHYAYRALVFPVIMRPSDKTFPVALVVFAVAFNLLNGFNNAGALLNNAATAHPWLGLGFWVGSGIFNGWTGLL